MTAETLVRIVLRLSNSCWCRYWLAWPKPGGFCLAIHCVQCTAGQWEAADLWEPDLTARGFRREWADNVGWVWVIDRTTEDGTPYVYGVI